MSKQVTPRLHSKHTDWTVYKAAISEKLSDKFKLTSKEDIEVAITTFIWHPPTCRANSYFRPETARHLSQPTLRSQRPNSR